MNERKRLIDPVVRWGIEPAHAGSLEYLGELDEPKKGRVPYEGEVLTLSFLVDPATRQPTPVRVTRIEYLWQTDHHVVVPVVVRATQA